MFYNIKFVFTENLPIYLFLGNEIQCFEYSESMINFKQRIVADFSIDLICSMPIAGLNVKINEIARFYFVNSEKKMKIVSIRLNRELYRLFFRFPVSVSV